MTTRSNRLALLAATVPLAFVLSACTEEAPPSPANEGVSGDQIPADQPVQDENAVLEVEDQTSEGPTVLARAAATDGGFVVVLAEEGRNVLGYSEVAAGTEPENVQISLAEEIVEEVELYARLFADTNGDGLYGAGDEPITNGEEDDSDDPDAFAGEQEVFQFEGKPVVNG
jgi:hypothetical protein